MAQDVVAAPPPPPAAAKPPVPPASPHPGDRDAGNAAAAVEQLLESFERVLAAVVAGRLPGVVGDARPPPSLAPMAATAATVARHKS